MPIFLSDLRIIIPEIEWQTIGNKLSTGGAMYVDIYHPTGILSAMVYQFLSFISEDNYILYRVIALLLIFIQAVLFNVFLIRHKAYNQNTYVPAAVYAISMVSVADFTTLSPQLLSIIFIILAFDLTFRHIEGRRKRDWIILQIGFYLGISFLFYSLNYLLLISTILGFLFYTNTMFRRYILLLAGFIMPLSLVWAKYFWFGQQEEFYLNMRYLFFPVNDFNLVTWKTLAILLVVPVLYMMFSFIKIFQTRAFINYQVRLQNYMLIIMILALLMIPMDYFQASHVLIMFVPPFAFYITHYLLLVKRKFIAEVMFILLIAYSILQNYIFSFDLFREKNIVELERLYYDEENNPVKESDKGILVIGNHQGEYYGNQQATPFMSWLVSRRYFNNLDKYPGIIKIYREFNKDKPEILVDKKGIVKTLFIRIPEFNSEYEKREQGLYYLK